MKALDLFCKAGGASEGIFRAGFSVHGVDHKEQPNYPFVFWKEDALTFPLRGFDFVWASPPCQRFSRMSGCRRGLRDRYPDLIDAMRKRLKRWGGPYCIENVVGSPLINPFVLCGTMFGKKTYRHRCFETNFKVEVPQHEKHKVPASKAGHFKEGTFISVAGHCAPLRLAEEVMDIDWMTRDELVEAIPPYFSELIAKSLL